MKFAIQFAYDGTDYCGWQIQRGTGRHHNPKPSIEGLLTKALHSASGEQATIIASGRTDAGVHASEQIAHFELNTPITNSENLRRALNQALPPAIQVQHLSTISDDFSARSAIRKQYSYFFQQGPSHLPQLRNHTTWNRHSLDGQLMNEAAQHLIGEHDFIAFGSANAKVSSTIRTIYEAQVTRELIPLPCGFDTENQFLWRIRIVGSGFLMHMMRSIAGTLKQIGEQRRPGTDIIQILQTGDRQQAGPTARSSGLWLDRVWYPKKIKAQPSWLHQYGPKNDAG